VGEDETNARGSPGKSLSSTGIPTAAHTCKQEPANAQQSFSASKDPTVWHAIPVLEFLQELWENMANHPKFYDIEESIRVGLQNLQKWYRRIDDMNVYFICLHQ
jgi:hypothetical protein